MQLSTYLTTLFGYRHTETQVDTLEMWDKYINQLLAKDKGIFQHLQIKEEGWPIIQAISSRHAVAVSNRSFKESQGMAAWVLYNSCNPKTALGKG